MPDLPSILQNFNPTEPVTKLIEAVRAGVGAWFEPTRIRRKADADAYASRVAAGAEGDAALIKAEGEIELQLLMTRAEDRTRYREIRRQRNIDAIVDKAIDQLPASVSNKPVDEDWMVQFFNYAQDVGNEEMQQLWAKLLAGEVSNPGSYSLRTLQAVRLLQPSDAAIFQKFASYIWDGNMHFHCSATKELLSQKGILHVHLLHLDAIGLLQVHSTTALIYADPDTRTFYYGSQGYVFHNSQRIVVHTYLVTDVGQELVKLCEFEPDEEYLSALLEHWRAHGAEVEKLETDPDLKD
ncbi:hypothetical protein TFLX_05976 [Thermoflexales bacterium]|nr:hypothetical protein TFLX_05976 [Thermoflexales bacterium]